MSAAPEAPSGAEPIPLPSFGETAADVAARLSQEGTLGLLVVDAGGLSRVEDLYGVDAAQSVLEGFAGVVHETARHDLGPADLVVRGESGRYEILLFLFREGGAGEFYRKHLPRLRFALEEQLRLRGRSLTAPFVRRPIPLAVGETALLADSRLGAESQVRRAIEEARRDAGLNARIEARLRRKELVAVLLAEDVTSVYEPIVAVKTRTVFAYEALARGPAGSPLHSPVALFESAAEEALVFELDCLCRRQGVAGALGLPDGTKLFLNVRPTAMFDPSFRGDSLRRTLEQSQLEPRDIVFEISEQESIQDFERFRDVRDYFGKLGVQFALDDTGAGYASLQAVMELQPEFIKVDRSFVSGIDEDPARQELLRALHSVASRIDARIIAEGLDTLEELATLERLGIPFGQGWLFGKPTPLRAQR